MVSLKKNACIDGFFVRRMHIFSNYQVPLIGSQDSGLSNSILEDSEGSLTENLDLNMSDI